MRTGGRGVLIIDTNLLVLLLVGALDVEQVERFRRTRAFARDDFALLAGFVAGFARLATTPNVLTEVSNLLGQLGEPLRRRALVALGAPTGELRERYVPSEQLARLPAFPLLGLADSSLIASVDEGVTVLTADLPLYHRLASSGADVVDFNHLRAGAWG